VESRKRPAGTALSGWSGRLSLRLGAGSAVFLLLALLVEWGAFTHLDQFAVDHLMPWLHPGAKPGGGLSGLVQPFGAGTGGWCIFFDLWNYPCSVLVSGLVVGLVAVSCLRSRRPAAAAVIASAWVIGNGVELLGKHFLTRPPLYGELRGHPVEIEAYVNSFPSGHMIRGILVVAALSLVLPRARGVLLLWLAPVGPFLVISSAHTVSDVLGGLVAGAVLAGAARALAASPGLEARARGLAQLAQRRREQATAP
jgi:membrane-associated phospholipid phosphatase